MLTIGEPMAVFASGDTDEHLKDVRNWSMHTAGAELNVAIGVARLGLESEYICQVGDDPFGHFLLEETQKLGVGTDYFKISNEYPTGIYFKQRVSKGDPEVFYRRQGSAASHFDGEILNQVDFSKYKIAHLSGIFPALSDTSNQVFGDLINRLRTQGVFITFDPNIRLPLWSDRQKMIQVLNEHAAKADLVLPGVNEGEILFGTRDPEEIVLEYFKNSTTTRYVLVKLGEKGALLGERSTVNTTPREEQDEERAKRQTEEKNSQDSEVGLVSHNDIKFTQIPGFRVDHVVDTVGAGDGFAVGLITGLMDGLSIEESAKRATAIGALAVQVAGDNEGYPTREELERFMRGDTK
jgi:2-dehydro-3-deoxygluconokinase